MTRRRVAAALLAVAMAAAPALAWEGPSTHAGIAEQAALASQLHARLKALGFSQGLYEPLTIAPADAKELTLALRRHDPSNGYAPDARGRQYAIGWMAAGAAIADATYAHQHFLDVATGKGWRYSNGGPLRALQRGLGGYRSLPEEGAPALDWIVSPKNPLGLEGFLDQYAKAVRGRTAAERGRHLAGALVAAGAIVHVVSDLGSPSHVRGDEGAHAAQLGDDPRDRGSRLERVAALAWGRLGVPAPSRVVTRRSLRGFVLGDDSGPGLAPTTAARWFSPGTLPTTTALGTSGQVSPKLQRPAPVLPSLNLMAASQPGGAMISNADGVCLARYQVDRAFVRFFFDDECLRQQVEAILPEVSSYAAGVVAFLWRGELTSKRDGNQIVFSAAQALGDGELEILAEDASGIRTEIQKRKVSKSAAGAGVARVDLPAGARKVIGLFRGSDDAGEPMVAVGVATP